MRTRRICYLFYTHGLSQKRSFDIYQRAIAAAVLHSVSLHRCAEQFDAQPRQGYFDGTSRREKRLQAFSGVSIHSLSFMRLQALSAILTLAVIRTPNTVMRSPRR